VAAGVHASERLLEEALERLEELVRGRIIFNKLKNKEF